MSGVAGNAYAYTGREWEPEIELYYYRARYYDPEAGRFLSRDPIRFSAGDSNLYAYVNNDALNRVDPDGLMSRVPKNCIKCMVYGKELQDHITACRGEARDCKTIEDEIRFMDKYDAVFMDAAIYNCVYRRFEQSHPELNKDFLRSCVKCVYGDMRPR